MIVFKFLDPRATEDHLGLIPAFFVERDPRPAVDQINERYAHGGGWFDLKVGERGFKLAGDDKLLLYPGDPPMHRLAEAWLHGGDGPYPDGVERELIGIYEHGFVSIEQPDGSLRVARLD